MKKILLTGVTGQLGYELYSSLQGLGLVIPTRAPMEKSLISAFPLDLADHQAIVSALKDIRPDIIVNAAAYTAVDKAEDDFENAMKINCHAPWLLAELAKANHIGLVHYSTDYVYSGEGDQPWREEDIPAPINAYGTTKLLGDQMVEDYAGSFLIFRTSWVYGHHGHNFIKTMLKLSEQKDALSIVDDQIGAPTSARTLANVTAAVLFMCSCDLQRVRGVYHVADSGETSWCGFAKKIFELSTRNTKVIPISTEDYPTRASRPKNSRLSCQKLYETFKIRLPSWEDTLKWYLEMEGNFTQ